MDRNQNHFIFYKFPIHHFYIRLIALEIVYAIVEATANAWFNNNNNKYCKKCKSLDRMKCLFVGDVFSNINGHIYLFDGTAQMELNSKLHIKYNLLCA